MPKATLLSGEGTTFAFRFGTKLFEFEAGIVAEVPTAIALVLKAMTGRGGDLLFRVEDLPTIVEAVSKPEGVKQNVVRSPRQLQFAI